MIVYGYGGNELTEYLGKKKDYNVTYDSLLNGVYVEGEMNDASSGEKQRFIDANIEAACLVYELDDYLSYDLETLVVDIFKNYGFDADDDDYMDDLVLKYENDSDVENALRDALEVCAGELFGDEDTMCYYMEEPYKLESSIELNDCASCVCREGNWACSSTCAEDTLYPSDVEDLSLTVLDDGRIKLRWDRAVDDTAVAGYQIHYGKSSVSKAGQTYDTHIDVGNVLTHYFTDLDEGTKYYFSVVAYDLEGSESLSWATEVSGVPTTKDTDPPDVISSESIDSTHVGVEFNEPIVLSTDPLRNFEIVSVDDSGLDLEISEVVLGENSDGIDDTYALLTTKAQENRKYTLTVSGVFDTEGNEIEVNSSMSVFEGTEELY